jgi:hypothetical protein
MRCRSAARNDSGPSARACLSVAGVVILLSSATATGQTVQPAVSCEGLAKLSLPGMTVTMAQPVAAGEFKMPARGGGAPGGRAGAGGERGRGGPGGEAGRGGQIGAAPPPQLPPQDPPNPAFCRVAATLTPTSDSDIKIEVWLPLSGWNRKFMAAGNSGWGGSIQYRGMMPALQSGYAVAGTDTGHEGNSGAFIVGHPEKWWHRLRHLRKAGHHRRVGRDGTGAEPDPFLQSGWRADGPHASPVCVSDGCEVPGIRQRRRCGELRLFEVMRFRVAFARLQSDSGSEVSSK